MSVTKAWVAEKLAEIEKEEARALAMMNSAAGWRQALQAILAELEKPEQPPTLPSA
jgi:hypothetical protein